MPLPHYTVTQPTYCWRPGTWPRWRPPPAWPSPTAGSSRRRGWWRAGPWPAAGRPISRCETARTRPAPGLSSACGQWGPAWSGTALPGCRSLVSGKCWRCAEPPGTQRAAWRLCATAGRTLPCSGRLRTGWQWICFCTSLNQLVAIVMLTFSWLCFMLIFTWSYVVVIFELIWEPRGSRFVAETDYNVVLTLALDYYLWLWQFEAGIVYSKYPSFHCYLLIIFLELVQLCLPIYNYLVLSPAYFSFLISWTLLFLLRV